MINRAKRDKKERFVCIHGHFYQPPRENPWIGAIERQPSAAPDHDWNCRIARECYNSNGASRVVNEGGETVDLVNNYAGISFNFGSTLLSWYEKAFPAEYRHLLEADRQSFRKLEGHGNALAQAYNHMILPLSNPRDRATQIRWGLYDFRFRFGRPAEALWLPETACDDQTLRALIEHGLKYVILAPGQAEKIRPLARDLDAPEEEWKDVSNGGINTHQPYRWFYGERYIDIFFYNAQISSAIAFEKLMKDSASCAGRFERAFGPQETPQLVSVATDGESYGHHESFADMGLAHLLKYQFPARNIKVVNYGYYLAKHPPSYEVILKSGSQNLGTSWSCAHGVGRWMEDCGCGAENGQHLRWRRPLREALDWLRDRLAEAFERQAEPLLKDAWRARDGYIGVILDRSDKSLDAFFREHLKGEDTPQARQTILRLMEMQRHCLLMYSSCGWFFSDISRIETVQSLKYAARALQLARQLGGEDLEREFLSRLKRAPSNFPEFGDGWGVYEKLVRPSIVTEDQIAAQCAISALFDEGVKADSLYHFSIKKKDLTEKTVAGIRLLAGKAEFYDEIMGLSWERIFLAMALPDQTLWAYVRQADAPKDYEALLNGIAKMTGHDMFKNIDALRLSIFKGEAFTLDDLFYDERARILNLILAKKLERMEAASLTALEEYFPLAEKFSHLGLEMPSFLRGQVELAVGHWLSRRCRDLLSRWDQGAVEEIRALILRTRGAGLAPSLESSEADWERLVLSKVERLEKKAAAETLKELRALIQLSLEAGYRSWRSQTELRFFLFLQRRKAPISGEMAEVAKLLNIAVEGLAPRQNVSLHA